MIDNKGCNFVPKAMNTTSTALGLMSGTSMDGMDAALVRSDGEVAEAFGPLLTRPYSADQRNLLTSVLGGAGNLATASAMITEVAAKIVQELLEKTELTSSDIRVIGFHGHTVDHRPAERITCQIGNGAELARRCGVDVIGDFRSADVAAGGEGAPLAPLYHAALAEGLERPLAVLNVGGVANVTWLGEGEAGGQAILAFDTGPGNALIDDWAHLHTDQVFDTDGRLAAAGQVDEARLEALLDHEYFFRKPPKSLDRNDFSLDPLEGLSPADGAATLTAFTARAVALAVRHFPVQARRWLCCGGGRHNPQIMAALAEALGVLVEPVEAVGWRGDALEAEAFAFLALRSLAGLPLSLPMTTGVARPLSGGVLFRARA
ncbi:MAG: anhydro-N-acetylmuramic acid kinase [Alphaproteobacteria bacterium]|jgi:anhydro-N-acetylmuramic acid kinase|nr:anhydro-N-acetylmuramic acid kinase [Alphaproteobacteria bacterium]MDP6624405.1 anhydro-N-acetylmuramic acid kinase [Alphaproteobacteria bacterium]|tara:strand:+ start:1188 stop:2315 length:1128 start_codon:yes stop_codon:yes gene_type:complete